MQLAKSNWWWLILFVFIGLVILIIAGQLGKQKLINRLFSSEQQASLFATFHKPFRILRLVLLGLVLFLLSFTLMDPRWGSINLQHTIEGIDIVLVNDISKSMLSTDVPENRLEYSKKLSRQLLSLVEGNRIGLTAFAGFAFNVIPLTIDIQALMEFMDQLSPDLIDIQGTNLEDAIRKAVSLFQKNTLTHKAIVLFTDGEDEEGSDRFVNKAIKEAKEAGVQIFTVAIGTPSGSSIPIINAQGQQIGFVQKNGKTVTSHLNEKLLKKIATETGGTYILGNENSIIQLAQRLNKIKGSKFGTNLNEFMEPQYQSFLLIALLLLLIYTFLPERKSRKMILPFALFALLLFPHPTQAFASTASQGVHHYRKGDFQKALESFQKAIIKKPENDILRFNEANTYYRMNQKDAALKNLLALTNSDNQKVKSKSFYNIGNISLKNKNYAQAVDSFYQALRNSKAGSKLYEKALKNLFYTKKLLKHQSQKRKKKNNKKKQDKDQNKNQTNSQQNQSNPSNQNQQIQTNRKPQKQPQKTITPNEMQNLLNLIEQEEKKHLKQKKRKGIPMRIPQNAW